MKTRMFTFLLAALSLALTAQASESLLDAGGMHSGSDSVAQTSGSRNDCASQRSVSAEDRNAADGQGSSGAASTGTPSAHMRVSDDAGEESVAETTSGSSAPGKSLAVPVKSRSTRWQSLVPGAIK